MPRPLARRPRWLLAAILSLATGAAVGTLTGSRAWAGQAEDLVREAQAKLQLADFARSMELLGQARAMTHDPKLLGKIYLWLGVNHAVMQEQEKARSSFRTAMTYDPLLELKPQKMKASVVELFTTVREGLTGELTVTADRVDAVVWVDKEEKGPVPLSAQMLPIGRHLVRVQSKDGAFRFEQSVVIGVDRKHQIQAMLKPVKGRLTVRSHPEGAEVLLDGLSLGKTPLKGVEVAVGSHRLELRLGDRTHNRMVEVRPDGEAAVECELPAVDDGAPTDDGASTSRPPRRKRLWTWIVGGGAVAVLTTGLILGAAASADHEEWQKETDPQRWDELKDSGRSKATAANVLLGVGGALAITAVVLYFLEGKAPERSPTTSLTPVLGDVTGISLSAAF